MESSMTSLSMYRFERAKEDFDFDTSKHSSVIAFVNRNYVKEGIFDKSFSKIPDSAYRLRENADYKDFEIISKKEAENQLTNANCILETTGYFLKQKWESVE